jgi:hypothetical protein
MIAIILSATSSLHSQELVNLFIDEIPPEILTNKKLTIMIDLNLKSKGQLSPVLIYYYLEYLNARYNLKSHEQERGIFELQKKLSANSIRERNSWIDKQKNAVSEMTLETRFREIAYKYLDKYKCSLKDFNFDQPFSFIPDLNKMNYIVIKYYKNNSDLSYSSKIDYTHLRLQEENEIRQKLTTNISKSLRGSKKSESNLINDILSHWYIFENKPNRVDSSFNYSEPYEIITGIIKESNKSNKSDKFSAFIGYTFFNNSFSVENSYKIEELHRTLDFAQTINSPLLNFGLDYKLFLKNYISFFYYLRFEGSFLINTSGQEIGMNTADFDYQANLTDTRYYENINFLEKRMKVNSINTVRIEISSPVFFITRDFFFEVGISSAYNILCYELTYQYNYYRKAEYFTFGGWDTYEIRQGKSDLISENKISTDIVITPIINVVYDLSSHLITRLNLSYKFASLNVGLSF